MSITIAKQVKVQNEKFLIEVPKISRTIKVASFDLYDTIIMRRSMSAESMYECVWMALKESGHTLPACAAFINARLHADAASRHIDAPTLGQILQYLSDDLQGLAREIEATEISLEMKQLRLLPGADKQIENARHADYKIAFISDMHIGSIHLGQKLRELNVMVEGDLLMVSSDHGVSKSRRGRLFEHFLRVNDLSARYVTHIGNNEWSDVKMAEKHGITAHLCPAANPNRFESLLIAESNSYGDLEKVASLARDTRLSCGSTAGLIDKEISKEAEALSNVVSSVVSPVLTAFVLWAIKQCKEQSIATVRFLARDGELPYLISNALPSELTEGLDLGMLEVSRRSLLLPAASVIPIEKWLELGLEPKSFLVQHYDRLPARQVTSRVGITFERHADVLKQFGITDSENPLGNAGLASWKRALQADPVRQLIIEESSKRLSNTQAYLKQNLTGISDQRVGLIDIGWTGQQAAMLSALIRQDGGADPLHLHVGRLRTRPLIVPADVKSWLFDERVKRSPVENPVALFESFCVTTSGGVEGYQLDSAGIASAIRRKQDHKSDIETWGQPELRRCVVSFAAQAGLIMNSIDNEVLRVACEKLLKEFWESPNRYEAEKWGAFPYEQDQTGQSVRQLTNPYNLAQLKSRLTGTYSGIDWKAGSLELSPSPIRQILKIREKFRRGQKAV